VGDQELALMVSLLFTIVSKVEMGTALSGGG
jgi:hypothetical protein